jgi:putative ABC transport system ATP-binding protein
MKENNALLRLEGVGFKTDDAVILHNINLQLRPGEFKLITGPSGCGKSTLLKIIASLLSPTSGRLFFDDADIATLSPETYRQQVSYCAQTPALFGDSVYDNLIFPWQIRNKQPDPQALVADLQRFGLGENMLEKSINELSGGEKQRVSLIRNLQFLPRVLLLDEITSALDESNKQNVNDIIHRYATEKQVAVLWVTHDRNEISHADEVITLQPAGGKCRRYSMNGHNITNESLALSMVLVLIAILVSYREKLALEKDIIWSICRAIVQLIIVGYVLKYIFNVNHAVLTLLMVLFICFNAAWNAKKRSKYIDKAFVSSFIAITTGAGLTLAVLVFRLDCLCADAGDPDCRDGGRERHGGGGLCYNNMGQRFSSEQQQIQEKLSLGATPKMASARLIREHSRVADPTVDSAKTVGLVSLPGMMSGLIFAGIDPVKAIKYQIMVTFMLLSTASLSTIIAGYLTYRKFFNARHQLVVTQLKKRP